MPRFTLSRSVLLATLLAVGCGGQPHAGTGGENPDFDLAATRDGCGFIAVAGAPAGSPGDTFHRYVFETDGHKVINDRASIFSAGRVRGRLLVASDRVPAPSQYHDESDEAGRRAVLTSEHDRAPTTRDREQGPG